MAAVLVIALGWHSARAAWFLFRGAAVSIDSYQRTALCEQGRTVSGEGFGY